MRARLQSERGYAMVTAIILMSLMIATGLAAYASADTQQREGGIERTRESSFNLSEAAISAQVFQLSRQWPGPSSPYPSSCTPASTEQVCPRAASLQASFTNVDYGSDTEWVSGTQWTTSVRDNGGSAGEFYSDAITSGQPSYDASGPSGVPDGKLWVRSEAVVRGKRRIIVTQVKAGEVSRPFPKNVVTSGWFTISNSGNKVLVDTNGENNEFQPAGVEVRCDFPAPSTGCLDYTPSRGQVTPDTSAVNYPDDPALSLEARDELRSLARARGTYYATGCPASLTGELVFIENADCSYNNNVVWNSAAAPGLLVINRGTFTLGGGGTYRGLIYAANTQNSTATVVRLYGNAKVYGAIAVDGQGGLEVGSSGVNLFYEPSVFNTVKGYGAAAAVQGTFREIPPTG